MTKNLNKNKVPRLRFSEFKGDWTECTISDVLTVQSGRDHKSLSKGDIPVFGTGGLMRGVNEYLYEGKTVFIGRKGTINKPFYFEGKFWTVDTLFYTNEFKGIIPEFSFILFKKINWMKYNEASGVPSLSRSTIGRVSIVIPKIQEQQKIADFLGSVDAWLKNLRQQKTALETYKRGMMQKLFSQQVRFKDDEGNIFPKWQEKTLGDVFGATKGNGVSKEELDANGRNECILYGELYTTYNEVVSDIKSKTNVTNGTRSKVGDLLIPSSTTTSSIDLANLTALNKDNVLLGGDITILRGKSEISNIFYAYYLSNHKKTALAKYGQGVTIIHIYYSHFKDIIIDVPSLTEQQKIADFFMALDETILAKSKEIIKVEQWKKGLIQKMFI